MTDLILTSRPVPTRHPARKAIVSWILQIFLAAVFLLAGGLKLLGAVPMVEVFEAIGIGQWFRYVTGVIEMGAALALLRSRTAFAGAFLLFSTMACAAAMQLAVIGGSPIPAMILAGLSGLVMRLTPAGHRA